MVMYLGFIHIDFDLWPAISCILARPNTPYMRDIQWCSRVMSPLSPSPSLSPSLSPQYSSPSPSPHGPSPTLSPQDSSRSPSLHGPSPSLGPHSTVLESKSKPTRSESESKSTGLESESLKGHQRRRHVCSNDRPWDNNRRSTSLAQRTACWLPSVMQCNDWWDKPTKICVFSLRVLYSLRLPDLYFGKNCAYYIRIVTAVIYVTAA